MKLIAYHTAEWGGMLGSLTSTSVDYTEDGRCRVEIANRFHHSQPTERIRYFADGLLEKLSEVCERFNVIGWVDIPCERIMMLDASKCNDSFIFEDGTKIVFENEKRYPEYFSEMIQEINKLIEESKRYATDTEVIEEPSGLSMGMMGFQTANLMNPQNAGSKQVDTSNWAKFCSECGTKFEGNQAFCAECGAPRKRE